MSDFVKSAVRVFEILELFDARQAPLTLREIIEATGFPQSSTAALLGTMVRCGYVAHDRRRHLYMPTHKTTFLSAWVPHYDMSEERTLMELLDSLHGCTGETAVIATQEGDFVRYLHVKQARRPIMHHTQAGVLRPLHRSACGLALLSMMDTEQLQETFVQLRRNVSMRESINVHQVRKDIEDVQRQGFAVSRGLVYEHIGMVAIPISIPVRGRYIAIGLGGPVSRLDAQLSTIVRHLRLATAHWLKMLEPEGMSSNNDLVA